MITKLQTFKNDIHINMMIKIPIIFFVKNRKSQSLKRQYADS